MLKCKIAVSITLAFLCSNVFSQTLPDIEKKKYTSPDGKLYVQKSLPVYLMLNTNPDDKSGSVVLQSERTKAYSNPLYFDSEGLNTIRTPWCVDPKSRQIKYPKEDVVFEVYADSKPPVTKHKINSLRTFNRDGKIFVSGKVEVELSATDALSGVDKIMYSVDNEPYKEYSTVLVFDAEKEYVLQFFSYDNVGNVDSPKKLIIVVDNSKPSTKLEIKGDYNENVLAGNAQIVLSAEETASGLARVVYSLNNGVQQKYSGAFRAAMLPQGEHRLIYYAEDNLGNAEEQKEFSFYVDKTPPTIMQEILGKTFMINGQEFSSGRSQLKITSIDNKAGVKEVYYSINDSEYKLYEKPVYLSASGGKLSIKAYAVDKVNNRSQVADEAQSGSLPFVDLSGPVLGFKFSGAAFLTADTQYISSNTKIVLAGTDADAGMQGIVYNVNGTGEQNYTAPFLISGDGMHEIVFTGTDNVENTSTLSFKVKADNTGPEVFTRFSTQSFGLHADNGSNIAIYPSHVVLFASATDFGSGFEKMTYTINGSKEKLFTGIISGFAKNKNQVKIAAFDKLGNKTEAEVLFFIAE